MFILNPYTKVTLPLVLEIDTTKAGVTPSNGFQIPASSPIEIYSYKVDWGDGTKTNGHTGAASHTYAVGGIYQVKIYGKFPRMYFNNGGDRQKLLKVLDWGEINYSTNQTAAFWGCVNLDFIATDTLNAWYNNIVLGNNMFNGNSLTSLPDGIVLANLTSGNQMFRGVPLTSLPDGMTLASLTNGTSMFDGNSLTSLPDGMTLASLTNGTSMFRENNLTSLPSGMTLANLTIGNLMFLNNSLTSLPDGMTLASLTNGTSMFNGNSLTSLPDGMTLASLTNGTSMFWGNSLTSLPDGMVLANLTNGNAMFRENNLTSLPSGMTLANLTIGNLMFNASTINTVRYSQLLIDMEALNPNNNVTFNAGNSKYNSSAVTARATLTGAPRNWIITDGGLA